MPEEDSKSKFTINWRRLVEFVIFNTFTWYFLAFNLFAGMLEENAGLMPWQKIIIWAAHFGAIMGAAIIGANFSGKLISRINLISLWICFGIISSFTLIAKTNCITCILLFSSILGVSFGLGLPSCMGIFADSTAIESRGRSGGFIWFAVTIGCSILGIVSMFIKSPMGRSSVLFIWRAVALAIFLLFKPKEAFTKVRKHPSYLSILRDKRFLLYFIPWIMFCVINYLIIPIIPPNIPYILKIINFGVTSLFALVGGVVSDSVGRKPVIIIGFIMLGISYAALGIRAGLFAYYLYTIMDSIAWGMFGTVFLMILWADLSDNMASEKHYAIGGLPYVFSALLEQLFAPFIETIPKSAAFSFASFFLFLSVLPLLYAPETLPESVIRHRELRRYIEKAKKLRDKYRKN